MGIFWTVIIFFLVLGVLVIVHEFGHFITARRAGVKVDEFGFGLPPRAIGAYRDETNHWRLVGLKTKQTAKTIWSLNWIPLGGFVRIKGEQGEEATDPDSFAHKSVGKRIWIISAGVLMNIILAAVLLTVGFIVGVPQIVTDQALPALARVSAARIQVAQVLPDSPADAAAIEIADTIFAINGQTFSQINEVQEFVAAHAGQDLTIELERDGEAISVVLRPAGIADLDGQAGMGVALVQTATVSFPWYVAGYYGVVETGKIIAGIFIGFYLIIQSLVVEGQLIGEVYGPVGIATLVGDAASLGFIYVLQLTAILSIIIAVINYLPFPALDGGRVLFLIIEAVRGRPVNQRFENATHNIGFGLLLLLILLVTYRDIVRITGGFFGVF
ncbi:MAG: hypothetical protein A2840_02180 [Candidatus Buchananbacteria bacterium RIFCSPHIGHO2_01_FULL_47_11b]|uniref:Zinc metalloprotease n=1 Tax=Candidatus Buchananbacteria bacterium RIFCSPHIGHO2_01_FULL_47_11b TaxID=1797537 RepID=A0A1G1Y715_9BACT|nr:MAG: hypothetical protein A2840_02180 [Candidatus Buchananbacteria bacterium RIFCSPHIGHO2_01_FULL_47_11b]